MESKFILLSMVNMTIDIKYFHCFLRVLPFIGHSGTETWGIHSSHNVRYMSRIVIIISQKQIVKIQSMPKLHQYIYLL
jgi:hypothetical protein